jgi:acyl-CoA-binding protein
VRTQTILRHTHHPQARFKASAEKAKTLSGLSNDELLDLYKYFKQVRRM